LKVTCGLAAGEADPEKHREVLSGGAEKKVVPQFGIAKLVPISPITMVYRTYNYS
jgi:hypothetical protein